MKFISNPSDKLNSMESDSLFAQFLESLHIHALKHPEKLKNASEVWDEEWQQLLGD